MVSMEEVFKLIPIHLELIFNRKMIFSNKLSKANLHLKMIFIAKYFKKKRKLMISIF
jgi:hypothetical protein